MELFKTNRHQYRLSDLSDMHRIKFKINGVEYSVGDEVASSTTLLEYLRRDLELRGTKYMCLEGGCGACIVSVVRDRGCSVQSVNSCLVSLISCNNWDITTIEKVGNRKDGYHPLQTTLAKNNGTQCGYCSPGWVMSMYSLMKCQKLTMLDIEKSLSSNVCRCTGYRPILDAFKRFACDYPHTDQILDIEDLKMCKTSMNICNQTKCFEDDWCFLSKEEASNKSIHIKLSDGRDWYKVNDIDNVFNIFQDSGSNSYMLVAGNTAKGVYPIDEYPKLLIDVTGISELKNYYMDQNLVIGAGTTLTDLKNIFETFRKKENFDYLKVLHDHLELVGNVAVRNLATIAGNLAIKWLHHEFQSDIFVLFDTVGAQVTIVSRKSKKTVTMQQFLKEDMKAKVILNVLLPPLNKQSKVVTFKIMPRSQNAHAIVNCGFFYKLDKRGEKVEKCRIAYGGLSPCITRVTKTENYLVNKDLFTNKTLQEALKVLLNELEVTTNNYEFSVKYRKQLALALFYKGLLKLCPSSKLSSQYTSGSIDLHASRPVSKGQQSFDTDPSMWPLYEPMPNIDGLIQCSGEAVYSDDMPSLLNQVFAAFVLTTEPLGHIDHIDPSKALEMPGVIAFYDASDIPGVNSFTVKGRTFNLDNEELLCDGNVKYFNQPLGIVVATTQHVANVAAKLVCVKYSDVKKPLIDIKQAKRDSSRTTLYTTKEATAKGTDIVKIIKGENTIYSQYNFCLETLVCVTYPIEDGLKVNASTQWPDIVQQVSSRALKIQQNRVDVYVRRLGGAFGYKISRASQIALACNMVALKLNRPCRFVQTLTNNMRAVGKRLPCSTNFEVGINKKGVIQFIIYELFSDNGYVVNEPFISLAEDIYYNAYRKALWNYKAYDVTTDTASNTWCRSPGTLEHIAMAEWIMERISYEMNLDALEVRLANVGEEFYSDVIEITETLKNKADYNKRKDCVDQFNCKNRWKKRGLRFTLLRWVPTGPPYYDVNMSVYHEDGSVAIVHGAIEMGQGLNTKAIQICAYILNIPVEKITVKPYDSVCAPNSFATGGSITSSCIGIGVQRCCENLLSRLEPVKIQLGDPSWEELIRKAFEMNIDLQTHAFVSPNDLATYNIYGLTLAEVEIDVLTGELEIIRVDLLEDVGSSINPYVDIGQIEGAYVMGVGYWTSEHLILNKDTGEVRTNRTWNYWVPQARDIPQDFRIYFRKRSYSTELVLGSKATGEPATCMGVGVAFAIRAAIVAARTDAGLCSTDWFEIDGPYTVDKICLATSTQISDYKFN